MGSVPVGSALMAAGAPIATCADGDPALMAAGVLTGGLR
jgi:hypothetical protein